MKAKLISQLEMMSPKSKLAALHESSKITFDGGSCTGNDVMPIGYWQAPPSPEHTDSSPCFSAEPLAPTICQNLRVSQVIDWNKVCRAEINLSITFLGTGPDDSEHMKVLISQKASERKQPLQEFLNDSKPSLL